MRSPLWLLTGALTLSLFATGCSGGSPSSSASAPGLHVSFRQAPQAIRAGERHALRARISGADETQLFGAMMSGVDSSGLTQWHVEPANAASIDPVDQHVTFHQPGKVKIWASWRPAPDKDELVSTPLELEIEAAVE